MRGEIAVSNDRADPNRAIRQLDDLVQWQVADVDDQVGRGDSQLHAVDQVRAAGQVHGIRVLGHRRDAPATSSARRYSNGITARTPRRLPAGSLRQC